MPLDQFKEMTQNSIKDKGVNIEDHFIIDVKDNHIGKTLNDYVSFNEDIGFDFCVIGNCGVRARSVTGFFVGRIANYILKRCVVNAVIVP